MSPLWRRRLGRLLLWIGVLAWLPYLYQLAQGERVSLLPFLAVHLVGVFGGSALRRSAGAAHGAEAHGVSHIGRRRYVLGRALMVLGVLAWAPYFYLHSFLGRDIAIGPYLAAHLTGVLGGSAMLASARLSRYFERKSSAN